ncbi:MAG: putative hydrolases of the HAD superfamily [Caldanaerobacter subterraneus]|uniref:Cof-type HAD-IIB family hydrolase n=1 Tax=Caldanaerobacter subterraneus TaxID=911092 RepID=A0A101E568_9THEO|nr:HAD family hydrolase [Caldanaerobacter subterraneus]KUK09059.1 MAG: putative hydrolases of the HAD superfamily [Caldanaerobacter subterraneus]HBT50217.1 Cof-type HAD-IIB family hydrolase [Caldanaerobacter subterraneus]
MYKLLVSDADGSLLNSNSAISDRTKEAVREVISRGVIFTIATGRMFSSILPYAEELKINAPVISYNGALIKDIYTKKVYYYNPIPSEDALFAIKLLKENGYHINLYIDDELYVEEITDRVEWYLSFNNNVKVNPVGDLIEFLEDTGSVTAKIYALNDLKNPVSIDARMYDEISKKLTISTSGGGHLEINAKGVSKGNALKTLANMYNIKREQVVAIGDNLNDLSMIEYAGLGVAMGNAPDIVKIKASYTTLSNDEDGVAHVIDKFFLNRKTIAV